jgi:hypothetical protein
MTPNVVLSIVLASLGTAAVPCFVWLRAQRRIRHLEMTLLTQTTDVERYDELRLMLQQVATQVEHLADAQTQLARRLGERSEPIALPRAEPLRPVTPH